MQDALPTPHEHPFAPLGAIVRARRWRWSFIPLLRLLSLVVVAGVTLPVLYLALRASEGGTDALEYLTQERTLTTIGNSLWLMLTVTLSAGAIGIPFAWLTTSTDLPLRRVWLVLGLLTMVIPSYLAAIAYVAALGPVGLVQNLLAPLGVERLPDIRGFWGAWLAMTLFTYPYVVLPVRSALLNSDPALEEVGYSMGLNRWQVFARVILPQLYPAMLGGMMIAAMYTLSDFGAVAVMRYNAFTRAIYLQMSSFRPERAALLAFVLILCTLCLLALEWRINSRTHNFRIGTGTKRKTRLVHLGYWKGPALLFCGILVGVGVFAPIAVLAFWMLRSVNIESPIEVNPWILTGNTLSVSALSMGVAVLCALPLALLVVRRPSRFHQVLVSLSYTGYVLPGIVSALALVYFASNYANPIYQTLPLLVFAYATRFLPLSISATRSALTQINPRLEEVARSLGLSSRKVIWRVTLPLARTGILAGAALVFLNGMKELPMTLILRPIGFETLATRIWSFSESAMLDLIGIPGFILMGVSALALVVMLWTHRRTA